MYLDSEGQKRRAPVSLGNGNRDLGEEKKNGDIRDSAGGAHTA